MMWRLETIGKKIDKLTEEERKKIALEISRGYIEGEL